MNELLAQSAGLPELSFEADEEIISEGTPGGAIWILVSGALRVHKNNVVVNEITTPGAVVGEISALLGTPYSATVQAAEKSVLRCAEDGAGLLASDPEITMLVARGLAERLNFVTTYLVDLKQQYGDEPGLAMIPTVLRQLLENRHSVVKTGSARDPDPEY